MLATEAAKESTRFALTNHEWIVAVVGAAVGLALGWFINLFTGFGGSIMRWWRSSRPIHLLLDRIGDQRERVLIFVRDFGLPTITPAGTNTPQIVPLTVHEALTGASGLVGNVNDLWSRVEASAYGNLLYLFGLAGKNKNVEVVEMSVDTGKWDANIIVLGAQAERCYQFYEQMRGVAFSMTRDGQSIVETSTGQEVQREVGFGYGIILKVRNPHRTERGEGVGLLIGGFGVLGTEAAGYYLRTRYRDLVRIFGDRTFGVVVRAGTGSGAESVERVRELDRATERKSRPRKIWEILPGTFKQVDKA